MKRLVLVLLTIFLVTAACRIDVPNTVNGSGNVVAQSFDVSGFDQVKLNTIGEVYLEQGDSESLTIETDDNILPMLDVTVEGGKLILDVKNNRNIEPSVTITYRITVEKLNAVIANSSGDVIAEPIAGDSLDVFLNASGNVTLKDVEVGDFSITSSGSGFIKVDNINAENIHTQARASGKVEIAGEATSLQVGVDGSGDVNAGDLQTSKAEGNVQGSGDVTVWAVDTLDVTIGASGNVDYYGNPKVTENLTASGVLQALGEK